MLRTGPEERLSHTNTECRCSDMQTTRYSEERAEQRGKGGGEAGRWARQAGEDGERERTDERTASRSAFYKPRVKGGATTRSSTPSSELCRPIGSRPHPARLQGLEAFSFAHPARHGQEPCTELPCRVLVTGRGSCWSRMPVRGTPGELRLVLLTCLARPHAKRSERPGPRSTPIWWHTLCVQNIGNACSFHEID